MPATALPLPQNELISRLPHADGLRLLAGAETVHLALGTVLCEPGEPWEAVYFPVGAFISLVVQLDKHPSLEVGMIGREGLLGSPLVLGVTQAPLRGLVQGAGSAWRLPADAFRSELARSLALRELVQRYVYVHMVQMAGAAACLRFHLIGPRLARWLLMSQDRAHAPQFHVTHEFLANMLGVRRVGVTAAAGALQQRGLIRYHRGELTVMDRAGLESAACDCYAADRASFRAHMSPPLGPHTAGLLGQPRSKHPS